MIYVRESPLQNLKIWELFCTEKHFFCHCENFAFFLDIWFHTIPDLYSSVVLVLNTHLSMLLFNCSLECIFFKTQLCKIFYCMEAFSICVADFSMQPRYSAIQICVNNAVFELFHARSCRPSSRYRVSTLAIKLAASQRSGPSKTQLQILFDNNHEGSEGDQQHRLHC